MQPLGLVPLALFLVSYSASAAAPPPVIFHAGRKAFLLDDVREHNVPLQAWTDYIIGDSSRFSLPRWRRGLYGASQAQEALQFAGGFRNKPLAPWLIAIHIKEECRLPDAVAPADFFAASDSQFVRWIDSHRGSDGVSDSTRIHGECMGPSGDFLFGDLFGGGEVETICTRLLDEYLDEHHYRVVTDAAFEGSWYIRDRNCIADITGSPDDLVTWFQSLDFWRKERVKFGSGGYYVFTQALGESVTVSDEAIIQIQRTIGAIRGQLFASPIPSEGYRRKEWDDFDRVTAMFLACSRRGLLASFRDSMNRFHSLAFDPPSGSDPRPMLESILSDLERTCM